jgi:hypothetical protein
MLAEYKTLTGTINRKAVNKALWQYDVFKLKARVIARKTLLFHVVF